MRATVQSTVIAMVAAAAACLTPALASAQAPAARVVLYEVSESLKLTASQGGGGHGHRVVGGARSLARLANAALLSNNLMPLSAGTVFATAQYMTATAQSDVSLDPNSQAFGTGPINGKFNLAVYQDLGHNGQKILSDLVVIASGELRGTLDLRDALDPANPQPIAPVEGRWRLDRDRAYTKVFAGVFLIPFQLPQALAVPLHLEGVNLYLDPPELEAAGSICASGVLIDLSKYGIRTPLCQVSPDEHVLGFPLTKAVIFLFD